jgi:hypothetical protein
MGLGLECVKKSVLIECVVGFFDVCPVFQENGIENALWTERHETRDRKGALGERVGTRIATHEA